MQKQKDVYKGRKKSLSEATTAELKQRLADGITKIQVVRKFGISQEMPYQYLRVA